MDTLSQEFRYALRKLVRNPGFTAVAVIALALGIGANTSIFSVVNAVLIRSLPFDEADRLVVLWENNQEQGRERDPVSPQNYLDWRDQSDAFEALAAWAYWGFTLGSVDQPERVPTIRTSPSLFALLGAEAALGRTFTAEENELGGPNAVVLSHGLWERRFGSEPGVIGSTISLDLEPYTIVGGMPSAFRFPDSDEIGMWTPAKFSQHELSRARRFFNVIGRLAPGVSLEQAQAEMDVIAARLGKEYPDTNLGWGVAMTRAPDLLLASNQYLLILLAAVGLVLLIACANVANLLLARAADRHREIAVRRALGAQRFGLIRQLLIESFLLAGLSGVAALVIAVWGIDLILALEPGNLPHWNKVGIDTHVLTFTAALALLTALIAGIVPAVHASRPNLNESLKEGGGRLTAGSRAKGARGAMVVTQIALAVVLLIGAGLLIRSFARLLDVDPGFNPTNVAVANIFLAESRYPEDHLTVAFFDEVLDRVESLPGVIAVGATTTVPIDPVGIDFDLPFDIEGQSPHEPGQEPQADYRVVTTEYLSVMGIPLLRGRAFQEGDREGAPNVMIINQTMARRFFGGVEPVGKRIRIPIGGWFEVIGVVGDIHHRGLDAEPRPELYVAFHQQPHFRGMVVAARTTSDPSALARAITREVFAIDPDQAIAQLTTMSELLSGSVSTRRFNTTLLGGFAVLALALAVLGIYSVVSYGVSQRAQEIGVRMAMGARGDDVIKMIVAEGLKLAVVGVTIGVIGAIALTRLITSLLYDVSPVDPVTFLGVSLVLALAALVASYIPALKATRVDPVLALKHE